MAMMNFLQNKTQNGAFTILSGFLKPLQYRYTFICPVKSTKHLLSAGLWAEEGRDESDLVLSGPMAGGDAHSDIN